MEKILQPILKSSIEKIENDNGVKINDLEWIKYKVVGVSNNIVTFEQEIKSK